MLIALGTAAALALTAAADAKPPADLRVCGSSSCVTVADVDFNVADPGGRLRSAPRPAPFHTVRFLTPTNVYVPGTKSTILYLWRRGIWSVRIGGVRFWVDVPARTEEKVRQAARGLRPFAAPARWPRQ
jgi:hypothetical protein